MKSYLKSLQCSRCRRDYPSESLQNLCECGAPLFARYDLAEIARLISREELNFRVHSLWRYWELLPIRNPENCITLEEGFTPMLPSLKTGPDLGLRSLWFKDESMNPTGSFKARGMSVAVSKAKEFGVKAIALPSAGNAGSAAAAYAARGGLKCHVSMPRDTPQLFISECRAYGANVSLVEGYITDASRSLQKQLRENNWFDVSTCKEPYRIEGKKTILFEIAQHLRWKLPDVIIFPTGGGTGIVAAWKAVAELQSLGWVMRPRTPRLIAVQSEGCAPIVRAYDAGEKTAREWENPQTNAWGLRVPKAVADFLILEAIRESQGLAIAVSEQEIGSASALLAQQEGLFVAPEAAAGLAALQRLVKMNLVEKDDVVVILLTGSGLKYVHAG